LDTVPPQDKKALSGRKFAMSALEMPRGDAVDAVEARGADRILNRYSAPLHYFGAFMPWVSPLIGAQHRGRDG